MGAKWPAWIVAGFVFLFVGAALLALVLVAADGFDTGPRDYLARILGFTLLQAFLSTALSVGPAIFVARALARRQFPGRGWVVAFLGLPLALPPITAALGVLAVWGRRGWASEAAVTLGVEWPSVYGLPGILLAHVFFNLALATRLLLAHLERVPAEQWRLAAGLGLSERVVFRHIEWPALRAGLPATAGLVFMLCLSSFAIVLMLGGGPGATTLEVAIYQSLGLDFRPARAVALAALQLVVTIAVLVGLRALGVRWREEPTVGRTMPRRTSSPYPIDALLVSSAVFFTALPFLAILVDGVRAEWSRLVLDPNLLRATLTSLLVASAASVLATGAALALVAARGRAGRVGTAAIGATASLTLVIPPLLLGAGWFVALARTGLREGWAAGVLVIFINAIMALPFAVRTVSPVWDAMEARTGRLVRSLAMTRGAWARLVAWPLLRRGLLAALAFAGALSLGDLGAIALLGSDGLQTLPHLLMLRMGSYRTVDAAGIGLWLAALALLLFAVSQALARKPE